MADHPVDPAEHPRIGPDLAPHVDPAAYAKMRTTTNPATQRKQLQRVVDTATKAKAAGAPPVAEQAPKAPKGPTRAERQAQTRQASVDNPTRGTFIENAVPAPMVAAKHGELAPTAPKLKGPVAVSDRRGGATVTGARSAQAHRDTLAEGVHGTEEETKATIDRMASRMPAGGSFDVRPWGENKAREATTVPKENIHEHLAGLTGSKNVWVGMQHPDQPGHSVGAVLRKQGSAGYRMAGPLRVAQNVSAESALPQPTVGNAVTRKADLGTSKRERKATEAEAAAPTAEEIAGTPVVQPARRAAATAAGAFQSHMAEQNRRARTQPDLRPTRATDEDEPDRQRGAARVDRPDDSVVDKDLFGNPAQTVTGTQGHYPADLGGGRVGGDTRPTQGPQRFAPTETRVGERGGLPAGSNWMHPDQTRAMSRGEIRDQDTARHNQQAQSAFELQRTSDTKDRVATESHPTLGDHATEMGKQFRPVAEAEQKIIQQGAGRERDRYAPVAVQPRSDFTDPAMEKIRLKTPVPGEAPGTVRRPGYAPEGIQPGDVPAHPSVVKRAQEWADASANLGGRAERAARLRGMANVAPGARQGLFVGTATGTVGGEAGRDATAAPASLDESARSGYAHSTDPTDQTQEAISDYHHFAHGNFGQIRGGQAAIEAEKAGAGQGSAARALAERAGIPFNPNHSVDDMKKLADQRQREHWQQTGVTPTPVTRSAAGSVNEYRGDPTRTLSGAARVQAREGIEMNEQQADLADRTIRKQRNDRMEPGQAAAEAHEEQQDDQATAARWMAQNADKIGVPEEVPLTGEHAARALAESEESEGEAKTAEEMASGKTDEEKDEDEQEKARDRAAEEANAAEAAAHQASSLAPVDEEVTGREDVEAPTLPTEARGETGGEGAFEKDPYALTGTRGPQQTTEEYLAAQQRRNFNTQTAQSVWPHNTAQAAPRAVVRPDVEGSPLGLEKAAAARAKARQGRGMNVGPANLPGGTPPQRYWTGNEPPPESRTGAQAQVTGEVGGRYGANRQHPSEGDNLELLPPGPPDARDALNPRQMATFRHAYTRPPTKTKPGFEEGQAIGGEPAVRPVAPALVQSGGTPPPNPTRAAIASHPASPPARNRQRTIVGARGTEQPLGTAVPGSSAASGTTLTPEQRAAAPSVDPVAQAMESARSRSRNSGLPDWEVQGPNRYGPEEREAVLKQRSAVHGRQFSALK